MVSREYDIFSTHGGIAMDDSVSTAVSLEAARAIMGNNFFGLGEALAHFGLCPNEHELQDLARIPFSHQMLERYGDTHLLHAVLPISIIEMRSMHPNLFTRAIAWYDDMEFASVRGQARWYLIRKTPVENSFGKTYGDQRNRCGHAGTPTARVLVYALLAHALSTGQQCFDTISVRTSDTLPASSKLTEQEMMRVDVGFNNKRISILWSDAEAGKQHIRPDVGIATYEYPDEVMF
jgi:hypothetical protein